MKIFLFRELHKKDDPILLLSKRLFLPLLPAPCPLINFAWVLKYIYAENHSENLQDIEEKSLTSDNLTCMDKEWINKFYEAALEADTNVVIQLVGEIPQTETFLIQSLTKLARNFEFEQLIDLVEPLINLDV